VNQELLKKTVQDFAGAFKGLRLYPVGHPAIERQVALFHSDLSLLFEAAPEVKMALVEETLMIEDLLLTDTFTAATEIAQLLDRLELEGLIFETGLAESEISSALALLTRKDLKGTELEESFRQEGISHIRLTTLKTGEVEETPRKVYSRAIEVINDIFRDVRLGKIPSSAEALSVVKSMARITLAEPHALFALSMLKNYDNYTFTHSVNVSVLALAVGRACNLSEEDLRILGFGGLLHDLGKLRVDVDIITKPGKLTDEEFAQIKKHPGLGAAIVKEMDGVTQDVIDIILGHHVRFNKTGYPEEAISSKLSDMADMTAIADTYDAITTLRSYQRPLTPRMAVDRIRELEGNFLNPEFTERFITSLGPYPVGSLVRLDSNEIGLVVWVDTLRPDSVRLKILFDEDGNRLATPYICELLEGEADRIVKEVDPLTKGIDPANFFDIE